MVKLSNDELKCISLFESITGAAVEDCIIEPERIIFVVKEGEMGRAIGKAGATIQRVRDSFNKRVDVLENAETAESFVRRLYSGMELRDLKAVGAGSEKTIEVSVSAKDRGAAIGRNGERIKLGRTVLERRFGTKLKLI